MATVNWHRFVCGFDCHYWVRIARNHRGCAICNQQQRYIEDAATGLHGFWCDIKPLGRLEEVPLPAAPHPARTEEPTK